MITVVTSIVGKGKLIDQPKYGCDYIAFTEQESSVWHIRRHCNKFKNDALNAKIHKILTHKYIDSDYFMWIDGGVTLKTNPEELVELMGDKNFLFFKHPVRDCISDEIDACRNCHKGDFYELTEQRKAYTSVLRDKGLVESAVYLKRNNPEANELMNKWWVEVCRHSSRDQISWPIVFKDEDYVLLDDFLDNKYFNCKK